VPVVFRFDERISERNFSERSSSCRRSTARCASSGRGNEVRVRIDGGWRPDRIYRVVLLPGVRDLFGNIRQEPAEIVFSTGPPIPSTAIAGIVMDRITGRPAQNGGGHAIRPARFRRVHGRGDYGRLLLAAAPAPGRVRPARVRRPEPEPPSRPAEPVDSGHVSGSSPADT
jgi:hypothetical protein